MSLETCQFCERWNKDAQPKGRASPLRWPFAKVKYGVRHYAHAECYVERRGLEGLRPWQIEQLPYQLLKHHNLLPLKATGAAP